MRPYPACSAAPPPHQELQPVPLNPTDGLVSQRQGRISHWFYDVIALFLGSPLLVQVLVSTACRLFFIASENTQLVVVTVLKQCFADENFLYQSVVVLFVAVIVSTEIKRRH